MRLRFVRVYPCPCLCLRLTFRSRLCLFVTFFVFLFLSVCMLFPIRLLLSEILNSAITNRVNGVTHDFVSEAVVAKVVKLNILAAVAADAKRRKAEEL